jgi:cell division protease FtsH
VHKISIIPRGIGALGYTLQRPTEDRPLMTREELEDKMAVLLGGRAAEHLIFDHLSTGAADDIARATDMARSMVTRYGMVESMGHVAYQRETVSYLAIPAADAGGRLYSEATAREIDRAVRDIVGTAFERARGALAARRDVLEEGARRLLERETLEEAELRPLFERARMHGQPSPIARAGGAGR